MQLSALRRLREPHAFAPSWTAAALILIVSSADAVARSLVNHDAAWYLYMAAVLLNGGTLYRDVVDTNPPLMVYLSVLPVWLGRVTGLSPIALFKIMVFALALGSWRLSVRLAADVWPAQPVRFRRTVDLVLLFLLLPFAKGDFGQREHLLLLMTMPYVLAAAAWTGATPLAVPRALLVGALAGVGLALKPYFLLLWLMVEACLAAGWRGGGSWRRPEALAIAAVLLGYAASILLFVPQYFEVASRVVRVYHGFNADLATLLGRREVFWWVAATGVAVLLRPAPGERNNHVLLFTASTAGILIGLTQLKGWDYHMYPGFALTLLFLAVSFLNVMERIPDLHALVRGGARGIVAVLLLALSVASVRYALEARRGTLPTLVLSLAAIVRQHAPVGPIFVMGMGVYPAFPLVNYTGAEWSTRYHSFWFLPGLYLRELSDPDRPFAFRRPNEMGRLEREFFDEVVADVCAKAPRLLIVENVVHRRASGTQPFDLVAYYSQDPRFARLFAGFRERARFGSLTVYRPDGPSSCR